MPPPPNTHLVTPPTDQQMVIKHMPQAGCCGLSRTLSNGRDRPTCGLWESTEHCRRQMLELNNSGSAGDEDEVPERQRPG